MPIKLFLEQFLHLPTEPSS